MSAMNTTLLKPTFRVGLSTAIFFIVFASEGLTQRSTLDVSDRDPYESLTEKAFPWIRADDRIGPLTIAMRFRPSFSPESEIILRFDDEGVASVDYVKAGISISELLSKPGLPSRLSPANLEKALQIERKKQRINPPLSKQWLDDFWDSLARSPIPIKETADLVQLDGTKYELQFSTRFLASCRLTILDNEVDSKVNGKVPIVYWMNSVRLALDALH
jgi:hypothetical protein